MSMVGGEASKWSTAIVTKLKWRKSAASLDFVRYAVDAERAECAAIAERAAQLMAESCDEAGNHAAK